MSSFAATRFHTAARPRMFDVHGETVDYLAGDAAEDADPVALTVIFQRMADGANGSDGLATSYQGDAACTVQVADLPTEPPPQSTLVRDGVTWAIRRTERKDAWTWVLHLGRPDDERRLPGRRGGT